MKNDSLHSLKNSFSSSLSLDFHLPPDQIPSFFPLLQKGFTVKARVGISIQTFLGDHFGVSPEYLRDRVKTIFLDGKTVDDPDKTLILDGSRLALSAAMPGLAGAVLRRGSPYAGLRSRVTERVKNMPSKGEEGCVSLKLFNLLLPELGPVFLRKGILISRQDFLEFWGQLPEETWRGWKKGWVNKKKLEIHSLVHHLQVNPSSWIRLEIREKNCGREKSIVSRSARRVRREDY